MYWRVIAPAGVPSRQEKAAERSLGYGQGLRRRARPARRDPKGGGYRTRSRVKALARCEGIALRAFPSLSYDIRRDAPVHGEKAGLTARGAHAGGERADRLRQIANFVVERRH